MVNSLENIDKSKVYVDRIEGLDEVVSDVISDTLTGAVSTITTSDLTAGKVLVSDNNGKVAAGSDTLSDLVHKAGNEIITGDKSFNSSNDYHYIHIGNTSHSYDETVNNSLYSGITFEDKNNAEAGFVRRTQNSTDNILQLGIKGKDGTLNQSFLGIDSSGNKYMTAPTPTDTITTSGNQVATTGWVNSTGNNVVHLTGDESITGFKTVENNIALKDIQGTIGTTTNQWAKRIQFTDSTGARIARLEPRYVDATTLEMGMYASNGLENESGIYVRNDGSTYAPTPSADDNSTKIATTAWVKSQGYMSSGNIFPNGTWVPVGDDAYMGDANHSGAVCFKGNNDSTKLMLINRAQNVALGFYIDENDGNALKLTNPTYSANAWGSVTAMVASNLITANQGYIKFNHGIIIQWFAVGKGANFNVTFPTAFSSDSSYGIVSGSLYNNGSDAYALNIKNKTSTGFTGYLNNNYTGASCIAIGY